MVEFNCSGVTITGSRQGSGPALLALHGGGGPASLKGCCESLAQRFDVVAPTHPGFADCPVADGIDSVDDLAYLYLDLLDELDLNDVTVMGFSLGGWIAAEMAVRSTARIGRLVLVDAVGIRVPGAEIADIFSSHPREMPGLLFHDPSNAPNPANFTHEDRLIMHRGREAMARYGWEPYLHNPKLKGRLHRIDVPTLLVWGSSDKLVPLAYGEAYRDAIPGAKLVAIDKAGHTPQSEQPEKFVSEILSFAAPAEAA